MWLGSWRPVTGCSTTVLLPRQHPAMHASCVVLAPAAGSIHFDQNHAFLAPLFNTLPFGP
jgi:hypothetical protein